MRSSRFAVLTFALFSLTAFGLRAEQNMRLLLADIQLSYGFSKGEIKVLIGCRSETWELAIKKVATGKVMKVPDAHMEGVSNFDLNSCSVEVGNGETILLCRPQVRGDRPDVPSSVRFVFSETRYLRRVSIFESEEGASKYEILELE